MQGEISIESLKKEGFDWFNKNYAAHSVEKNPEAKSALETIRHQMQRPGAQVLAFIGTWCPDTYDHLPAFIKIMEAAGVDPAKIRIFALDRDKKLPGSQNVLEQYDIRKVPTFVFTLSRQGHEHELGRIIESPEGDLMSNISEILGDALQEKYSPKSACFGCGPANEKGLRIRSHVSPSNPDEVIADWKAEPHHEAFPGMLNGGIIGALLDCHSNWTAAYHLMKKAGADHPPCTVTADYSIQLKRPTPTDGIIHLSAHVVDSKDDRATIEATLTAGGKVCATCRGTFVAVKPGHPAYHRW
jgi:acyl-coenzyme A thioesterase PaaI-like protein